MTKSSTYPLDVEFFDEDFMGTMSWNVMGKRILRAAALHAQERGFEQVKVQGRVGLWVLSRMVIEVNRMPHTLERGSITTWLSAAYRSFTDRCFVMTDADGNQFGQVSTVWALIDSRSRESMNLQDVFHGEFDNFIDSARVVNLGRPLRVVPSGMETVDHRKVAYSDLDKNGHLNSIRYIDYVLDTFSKKKHETSFPFRMELAYSYESMWGDTVDVKRKQVTPSLNPTTPCGDEAPWQFALVNGSHVAFSCSLWFKDRKQTKQ